MYKLDLGKNHNILIIHKCACIHTDIYLSIYIYIYIYIYYIHVCIKYKYIYIYNMYINIAIGSYMMKKHWFKKIPRPSLGPCVCPKSSSWIVPSTSPLHWRRWAAEAAGTMQCWWPPPVAIRGTAPIGAPIGAPGG